VLRVPLSTDTHRMSSAAKVKAPILVAIDFGGKLKIIRETIALITSMA
jgi:hypothetical protein